MSSPAVPDMGAIKRPKAWKHFAGALLAYPVLFLLWLIFDFRVLHPELANVTVETTMDRSRWFGVPLVAVILLFGGKWLYSSFTASARARECGFRAPAAGRWY